jgi:beta-galactosidase
MNKKKKEKNKMKRMIMLVVAMLGISLFGDSVWIEGDNFSKASKLKSGEGLENVTGGGLGYVVSGWGNTDMMSEGKVLSVNLSSRDVDKFMPESGLVFSYIFDVEKSGKDSVWARIGYESVRSDLQWRIDGGEWKTSFSSEPTINIQPIQTWNELAWIKLGDVELKAGRHNLEIRYLKSTKKDKNGNEKTNRILALLDAVCITSDEFIANGKYKPGESRNSAEDKLAAEHVFKVNGIDGSDGRAWTELNGLWQYAPWEETDFPIKEETRLQTTKTLPNFNSLNWMAYNAPGGRSEQLPEQAFAHRYILRTKLNIPVDLKGKSFILDVQRSSFLMSIFVNGKYVGDADTYLTAWQVDITKGVEAGKINDLVLVVKDNYYSLNPIGDANAATLGNRTFWNLPVAFLMTSQGTCGKHDVPIASDGRTGILEPASLIVAGAVYSEDVFCIPSVKKKELTLDITIQNSESRSTKVTVDNKVIPWNYGAGGKAEASFSTKTLTIPAGQISNFKINQKWANPKLWWPDNPSLYWVVTTISVNGKVVDTKKTRFGFREWDWSTDQFVLNGVKWTMWADLNYGSSPEEFMKISKKSHINNIRYWREGGWGDMTRREVLNYFDETGMLVRSSGIFDGQVANYGGGLSEKNADGSKGAKTRLFDAWREQMSHWIKAERNHASIYIWSIENEVTYINIQNLGQASRCEPEITKSIKYVMEVDPTRPAMVDGGNCLTDESLPINGAHYTEFMNVDFRDFPDAAYTKEHFYDKARPQRGAWRMVPGRPIMGGELYFANGYTTDRFATIGGDKCFIGMGETMNARGLFAKMLSEGYRWCDYGSFHFWMGNSERQYWNSWSPVAVFCKQWNRTWGSQSKIDRTLKVFNSTSNPYPIDVTWQFEVAGKKIAGAEKKFNIPCGEAEEFDVSFNAPKVSKRTDGKFILVANRDGNEVFRDEIPIVLLAPMSMAKPKISKKALAVFDPNGNVKKYLTNRGVKFTSITDYDSISKTVEVIVVGSDGVAADRSCDNIWLKLAADGKKIIILDQKYPLSYAALPGDLKPTEYTGRFGFSEDLSHPIFDGLTQDDFFTWGNDHIVYRNAYKKGTKGGRSLFQCDDGLKYTALFESQMNDGLLIISQLDMKDKIIDEAVAQKVFNNMLNYAVAYKPVRKEAYVAFNANDLRMKLLNDIDLQVKPVASVMDGIKHNDSIVIAEATPANLSTLVANKSKVDAFCKSGGWLMLWGLTPDGLADYNKLVGFEHSIRTFDKERVLLTYPMSKFAAGLTLKDVVMDTGKKMYRWMALKEPDQQEFEWVINDKNIAPFCKFPNGLEMGKGVENPGGDHNTRNMVNGFTSADNWVFTYTTIMDKGHKKKFYMKLPKEEELETLRIRPSSIYHPISKLNIYFDDDPVPLVAEVPVKENPTIEDIDLGNRKAKKITIEVTEWQKRGTANIFVIDNLWLMVNHGEEYANRVKSLLNVGGLMAYEVGQGGIFLNQMNIVAQEKNPDNSDKKKNITKTILKNLGAVFAGGKIEVDKIFYDYTPIKVDDSIFNAFVNQEGVPPWFPGGNMSALPVGNRKFGGVDFFLSDFSTSPVPSVFMTRGEGSSTKGKILIPINSKADSLFFLHTANAGRNVARWEKDTKNAVARNRTLPKKVHLANYEIVYEDGSKVTVPVVYGDDISSWKAAKQMPLPNAPLGWVGEQADGEQSAVWIMEWKNPNPEKSVKSVSLRVGNTSNGAAALFAVTVGKEIK